MTLLWYPWIRKDSDWLSLSSWRWAVSEKSLLSARGSSPGFQRYQSISEAGSEEITRLPEPRNPAAEGKGKEKEKVAHKRQISEAIPRNKRDNGGLSRPKAVPARIQENTQENTQAAGQKVGQEGTQEGARKSRRARKPKSRD
jgi:hypothetical protein